MDKGRRKPVRAGLPMQPDEVDTTPIAQVQLHTEDISVSLRRAETAVVSVSTVTHQRDHIVDEALEHQRIEIVRVPIGRYVDAVPAVRQDGNVTIMPVVEEVVVVERRLLLREEVHIHRVHSTEHHVETVQLRVQEAVITRTPLGEQDTARTDHPVKSIPETNL